MKTLNDIAKHFLGRDSMRPEMMQFHLDGDNVVATNAHIMIIAPKSMFDLTDIASVDGYPNYKNVIPESLSETHRVNVADAIAILDKLPKDRHAVCEDCKDCEGVGEVDCPCCGKADKCFTCNGTGDGKVLYTEYVIDEYQYTAKVGSEYFNPQYMMYLLQVANNAYCKEMVCMFSQTNRGCVYFAGGVVMMIMPLRETHSDNIVHIQTTVA